VTECKPLPLGISGGGIPAMGGGIPGIPGMPGSQGLTLLHSPLNVSAFCESGGAFRGCVGGV